jgi:hypothetical protein
MSLSSCTPMHRGYKFEDDDAVTLQQMVDKKANINQIINKFGSPSFINSPINDTLCYIDADGKKVAFNRFFKPNYQFMCVFFNEKQIATELKIMSLTKIKKTKMVEYNTSFNKPL